MKNKLIVILAIVVLAISAVSFTIFKNSTPTEAKKISDLCREESSQERVMCLTNKILSYVSKNHGKTGEIFDDFWQLLQKGEISDDPRIFSDIVHDAGMVLVDDGVSVENAMEYCGLAFKVGCMHGAVMEYLDEKKFEKPEEFLMLCDSERFSVDMHINCIHGVGHELAAKIKMPIEKVVHTCDVLKMNEERSACVSGILMEYSKGTAGSGTHSHMPIGKIPLPCEKISDDYKGFCYASAGSYREYDPNSETFEKAYQFCTSIPKEYQEDCALGVADRLQLFKVGYKDKSIEICSSISNIKEKNLCIVSVSKI